MIICPSAYEGKTLYDKSHSFVQGLKEYDPCLEAYRDNRNQTIVGWASRHGAKVHEFTIKRQEGETWPELERRVILTLPDGDVWKRFKTANDFDDYLALEVEKADKERLKDVKHNRLEKVKSEVDKIKFDHNLRTRKVPGEKLGGA